MTAEAAPESVSDAQDDLLSGADQLAEEDEPLLAAMKSLRRELAEAARVPAYVIFPDRTLNELATKRPANLDQMMLINGIGAKKLDKFGAAFLKVINGGDTANPHPVRKRMTGQPDGQVFDRLDDGQRDLMRGVSGLDPFMSCNSTTLARIAECKPRTLDELEAIPGVGAQKTARFGARFLEILHGE